MGSESGLSPSMGNMAACMEQHRYSLGEASCNNTMHPHGANSAVAGSATQLYSSATAYSAFSAAPAPQQLQQAVYGYNNVQNTYTKHSHFYENHWNDVCLNESDRQAAAAIASVRWNR